MTSRLAIFQSLIEAWKRHDADAVVALFDEDIEWHFAAGAAPPVRGKAKALKFLTRLGADVGEVRWRVFHAMEAGDRLFVEGLDEYVDSAGVRIAAPYAAVLEFRGDLIVGWRDYVDLGVIQGQKAGGGVSAHVEALIDRPAFPLSGVA